MEYILAALLFLEYILHRFERRDLYNRIMSRGLSEYKGKKPEYYRSAHQNVLRRWRSKEGEKEE